MRRFLYNWLKADLLDDDEFVERADGHDGDALLLAQHGPRGQDHAQHQPPPPGAGPRPRGGHGSAAPTTAAVARGVRDQVEGTAVATVATKATQCGRRTTGRVATTWR